MNVSLAAKGSKRRFVLSKEKWEVISSLFFLLLG